MKCIVIGAGAAGLMASSVLLENGVAVELIEARDRIGGRICTLDHPGFSSAIETGAEFIHGDFPMVRKLMAEIGTRPKRLEGVSYQLYKGMIRRGQALDDQWPLLLGKLQEVNTDIPFAEFLQQKFSGDEFKVLKEKAISFVEGYNAASAKSASTLALRDEWSSFDEDDQSRPEGGYAAIAAHMQRAIVSTNGVIATATRVREVRWKYGAVDVVTAGGEIRSADKALITVPIGVLQQGGIVFIPSPFPDDIFSQIGFGAVIKHHVEFTETFHEQIRDSLPNMGFLFSDASVPTWWTRVAGGPLVVGWLGGPLAARGPSSESRFDAAIDSLSYLLRLPRHVVKSGIKAYHQADWAKDMFAGGAYSFATLKTSAARAVLNTPVNETLFFAGEALVDHTSPGTVEAALQSGAQAAARILRRKPNIGMVR